MNAERTHHRWIERTLLLAVLAMQVAVFWQLRLVLRDGRAAHGLAIGDDGADFTICFLLIFQLDMLLSIV